MSDDERYVRERWERVVHGPYHGLTTHYFVDLGTRSFVDFNPNSGECWSAAAAFTREREEQIRQLRREIEVVVRIAHWYDTQSHASLRMGLAASAGGESRNESTARRTIARLESALAELEKGMIRQGADRKGRE